VSQREVQIVHAAYQAFERGGLDAVAAFWHPDIEWYPARDELELTRGPYRGHAGIQKALAEIQSVFPDLSLEVEEEIDAKNAVIMCVMYRGRGESSGVRTEIREAHLVEVRDGRIIRVREFRTRDEALEAVGRRK
jgi:ketosteroid isomerase-like protein